MGAVDALDCQGFGSGRGPVRGMALFPKIPNRWETRPVASQKSSGTGLPAPNLGAKIMDGINVSLICDDPGWPGQPDEPGARLMKGSVPPLSRG